MCTLAIHTTPCWQFQCALTATQLKWKYLLMANLFTLSIYLLLPHSSYSHESLKAIKCILYQSWHKIVPYWLRYACWLLLSPNIALTFQTILHAFSNFFPSHTFFMFRHNDEECILIHIHAHFDFEWSRNFPSLCINTPDILEESTRLSRVDIADILELNMLANMILWLYAKPNIRYLSIFLMNYHYNYDKLDLFWDQCIQFSIASHFA